LVDHGGVAQPKVDAPVILRKIARTGNALALLPDSAGDHLYLRADSVPIALLAHQANADPMPGPSRRIVQQDTRSTQIHQERIHFAVVVIIREGSPPSHRFYARLRVEERPGGGRHIHELALA